MVKAKNIRGVNLGGWLMMEGYLLGGGNIAESMFKDKFIKRYGKIGLKRFEENFRRNFINEIDFRNIAEMGANCVRLPFNCRVIEKKPYSYSEKAIELIKQVFLWCRKYKLGLILDLHAACGSQNCDWHSDSLGEALLWKNKEYQKRTYALWEFLAGTFGNEESLLGYDILNEPVLEEKRPSLLIKFYKEAIKRIKASDKRHLIFLEGNRWATQIDFLDVLADNNVAISIHAYEPLEYTFNFSPFYKFPGKIDGSLWDESIIYKYLEPYYKFSVKNKTEIFVGEFGINWRGGKWGESKWLEAMLKAFHDYGFGYTYWTYKAVANRVFPDGIYQSIKNCEYINRQGPLFGWDTYLGSWEENAEDMAAFWATDKFTVNKEIVGTLKRFFRKEQV